MELPDEYAPEDILDEVEEVAEELPPRTDRRSITSKKNIKKAHARPKKKKPTKVQEIIDKEDMVEPEKFREPIIRQKYREPEEPPQVPEAKERPRSRREAEDEFEEVYFTTIKKPQERKTKQNDQEDRLARLEQLLSQKIKPKKKKPQPLIEDTETEEEAPRRKTIRRKPVRRNIKITKKVVKRQPTRTGVDPLKKLYYNEMSAINI